jgi:hypothetical protein
MTRHLAPLVLLALAINVAPAAKADEIPIATFSGTLSLTYDSNPSSDLSYAKLQFSSSNTNGAQLNFLPAFQSLFGDQGQFGLDVVYVAPTNNQAVPTLTAYDYNGTGPVASPESISWAINDYGQNLPVGPGNPANIVYNSLFRGPSINLDTSNTTNVGTVYTLSVTGGLVSDGLVHWYDPSAGSTPLSAAGLSNVLPFTAVFTDDSSLDPSLTNFTGSGTLFVENPEPASCVLLVAGLAGVVGVARRKQRPVVG